MLYSINIAFLLPATMSVCSFRRIGLSVSYTILFSSILVRIVTISRQASNKRQRSSANSAKSAVNSRQRGPRVASELPSGRQAAAQANTRQQQHHLDPVDESVEVTFESLPYDEDFSSGYQQQPQQLPQQEQLVASISIGDQQQLQQQRDSDADTGSSNVQPELSRGSSRQLAATGTRLDSQAQSADQRGQRAWTRKRSSTSSLFHLPLALLITQFVISISWLIKQPPEPTLYFGCWHCSSPGRSTLLFYYEPLLSLAQPVLLLIVSWLWSVVLFRLTSANEEQYRLAMRRFLSSQPLSFTISNNPEYSRLKRRQYYLNQQLRESRALIITNTLLVFTWSLLALGTISSSQRMLLAPASVGGVGGGGGLTSSRLSSSSSSSSTSSSPMHVDDMSLVYANLISGAIIFCLLFVYRLGLFTNTTRSLSSLGSLKRVRSQYSSIKSSHDQAADSSSPLACCVQYLLCCRCFCPPSAKSRQITGNTKLFKNGRSSQSFAISESFVVESAGQQQPVSVHKFNCSDNTRVGGVGGGNDANCSSTSALPPPPPPPQSRQQPQSLFGSLAAIAASATQRRHHNSSKESGARAAAAAAASSSGQERLKLKQFNTYGTYLVSGGASETSSTSVAEEAPPPQQQPPTGGSQSRLSPTATKDTRKLSSLFNSKSTSSKNKKNKANSREQINFTSSSSSGGGKKQLSKQAQQLQRRQSNGSRVSSSSSSSTIAKLVALDRKNQMACSDADDTIDSDNDDTLDTISCAMSVASNATSQLQGNDLYPIDCSIQLDNNIAGNSSGNNCSARQVHSISDQQ